MDINFVESFSSIFLFPLLVYKSRIRQIRSWRAYCYVVNVDIIAFPQTELYIFYSEKLLWFVLDVRILYCSLVSPGFSLGVNLPLAEPFQCVEGFSHLLEATVLIKILLILWTDRSTTYILGTSKIQNVKAVHKSFSFSPLSAAPPKWTCLDLPLQAQPLGSSFSPCGHKSWRCRCLLMLRFPKSSPVGCQCVSVWGIPR